MAYIGNSASISQYAPQVAYFSGNGSTTAFTLPVGVVSSAQILVFVANVPQNPSSAYTVSGTTLTFTSAPPTGTNNVWVEYTSLQTNTIAPSAGTVNSAQLGTITTIPTTSANTITLPAATGTMMVSGNMPAFSAYAGTTTTSCSNGTFTKIVFDTEEFDTNNNFATSQFLPTVAGYYQINASVSFATAFTNLLICLYKNNSEYKRGVYASGVTLFTVGVSSIVYLNGSSDYVDIRIYQASGGAATNVLASNNVWFNGCLVRGA
jgi:hypothetical protein